MKSKDITRCRILIVDSSEEMLVHMTEFFRPYGFDLITTTRAHDAVTQAERFQPHAVYMGLEYEDCDGWELAARLRNVPGLAHAMLVGLLAGENYYRTIDSTGSHGFDYYLPKPLRVQDIVTVLAGINRL